MIFEDSYIGYCELFEDLLEQRRAKTGDDAQNFCLHEDVTQGKFDGLLGDDEEETVKRDLFKFYKRVFGSQEKSDFNS